MRGIKSEIALASDVLDSGVSAYTYEKNKNIDMKNGIIMLASVLAFTIVGIKFIVRPIMTTKDKMEHKSEKTKRIQSLLCGIMIGFICGFIGAGGGMMLILVLTSVLGYELKTAVGTSVFIMAFTALTGAGSHFVIGGIPDLKILILCMVSTLIFARIFIPNGRRIITYPILIDGRDNKGLLRNTSEECACFKCMIFVVTRVLKCPYQVNIISVYTA